MAVNKVNFGGKTLIDLTGDTLESAEQLLKGIIAHAKDGSVITGLMEAGGGGGGAKIITGEFTLDTAACGIPIEHNLGEVPNFAYYFALLAPTGRNQYGNSSTRFFAIYLDGIHYSYYVSGGMSNKGARYAVKAYDISNGVTSSDADGMIYAGNSATNSTIIIGGSLSNCYGYFKNATTYKWGVGVI